jgi:hypothetical protein
MVAVGYMKGDNNASLLTSLLSNQRAETDDERCPWENVSPLGPTALPT